jgi:hypothetical protein
LDDWTPLERSESSRRESKQEEKRFRIRLDHLSVSKFGVWKHGESPQKISTFIQNMCTALSSCDLVTDSGNGLEKFWLRNLGKGTDAEQSMLSRGSCLVELITVQVVSNANGSITLHLGVRLVEFWNSGILEFWNSAGAWLLR